MSSSVAVGGISIPLCFWVDFLEEIQKQVAENNLVISPFQVD
jgi:hypothetical protein